MANGKLLGVITEKPYGIVAICNTCGWESSLPVNETEAREALRKHHETAHRYPIAVYADDEVTDHA